MFDDSVATGLKYASDPKQLEDYVVIMVTIMYGFIISLIIHIVNLLRKSLGE